MSLILRHLEASLYGFAKHPKNRDDLFVVANVESDIKQIIGDIRDINVLRAALELARPEIVIHMAAQSLVRCSYDAPVVTYTTNVMGTINVLEAIRHLPDVRAVVVVTSWRLLRIPRASDLRNLFRNAISMFRPMRGCNDELTNAKLSAGPFDVASRLPQR